MHGEFNVVYMENILIALLCDLNEINIYLKK